MAVKPKNHISLFRKYNGKILDIQHATTTSAGTVDISAVLEKDIECIIGFPERQTGTGNFVVYANSGSKGDTIANANPFVISIKDDELKYQNSVKNDDWDIYCFGYWVKVPLQHLLQRRGMR